MSIPDVLQKKPQAIIFDTDNTLYSYEPAHKAATRAVEVKACDLLGVSLEKFNKAFIAARSEIKAQLNKTASSHSRLLYYQRTIEILGLNTQILMTLDLEQTYWRTFLANCRLFPEVKEFILDLKNAEISIAIITDLTAQIQFRKIIYFGLDNYFDCVVTSEEAGTDKPSKAPFEIVLKKLQISPENVWMIGDDSNADIIGASQFNMLTLQKKHSGVSISKDSTYVFENYTDLRNEISWLK
jgi:HAD superfamily hydrolase (TIGR01549 family)